MARTFFDENNKAFSDKAHAQAVDVIYPAFYGSRHEQLMRVYQATWKQDTEEAIDYIAEVKSDILTRGLILQTFQERFRTLKDWKNYHELTITEYNQKSKALGEGYKLRADFFLCGCFDASANRLIEVVIAACAPLIKNIMKGSIQISRSTNPKGQDFIGIDIGYLLEKGVWGWWAPDNDDGLCPSCHTRPPPAGKEFCELCDGVAQWWDAQGVGSHSEEASDIMLVK